MWQVLQTQSLRWLRLAVLCSQHTPAVSRRRDRLWPGPTASSP